MAWRVRSSVSRATRISPAAAACSTLAAVFITSPVASAPSPAPVNASPLATSMRTCSSTAKRGRRVSFNPRTPSRIANAHRTARSASSSCTRGTPKTATTASPANFSTLPPNSATSACIRSKNARWTLWRSSGSSRSPSCVEPTTSQNSAVTSFRSGARTRAGSSATRSTAVQRSINVRCLQARRSARTRRDATRPRRLRRPPPAPPAAP